MLSQRAARRAEIVGRVASKHYTAVGLGLATLGLVASFGPVNNRILAATVGFCLGSAASLVAGGLSEKAQTLRAASGTRLELVGQDVVERAPHVVYPDFITPGPVGPTLERNLRLPLPEALTFSSIHIRFSRHVAKEDMDAVRMLSLFLTNLGLGPRDIVVRRDTALLSEALNAGRKRRSQSPTVEELSAAIESPRQSIIAIGLGSNLVTKIHCHAPDSFVRLCRDDPSCGTKYEPVEVVNPSNSLVVVDRILCDDRLRAGIGTDPLRFEKIVAEVWSDGIVPLHMPPCVTMASPPLGYRFQSDDTSGNHFGMIVRKTLDRTLERRLLIIGGSGPLGTRIAGQYILEQWDELVRYVGLADRKGDFVAVVHSNEITDVEQTSGADLVPARETDEPKLLYLLVRSPLPRS